MNKRKALIFVNKIKDPENKCLSDLQETLKLYDIEYSVIDENVSPKEEGVYDVLFVIGGDGTILRRTEFANLSGIPIIGINAGKLGFLSEFEQSEIGEAVKMLVQNELVKEERATLEIEYNGNKFFALNDLVIQRIYDSTKSASGMVITSTVKVDDDSIGPIIGDGVIICTPTGSTAYSLSVGGAILAPGINAFSVTPIAAHSFAQRPIIYSANSAFEASYDGGASAGLFVDGRMVAVLNKGGVAKIKKADKPTLFYKRKACAFYTKLSCKLKDRAGF